MLLQQAGMKGINIAGWFCGAYGYDAEIKVAGINFISINSQMPCRTPKPKCDGVRLAGNRDEGTPDRDCWDAVVIKQKERRLKLFRFGWGEDRDLEY